jgi:hypothetical protein
MNKASRVNGMDTIALIINRMRTDVASYGKPSNGRNGIGNITTIQIPTTTASIFHLCLSLALMVAIFI